MPREPRTEHPRAGKSPVSNLIEQRDGPKTWTVSEVVKEIGISKSTLRRLYRLGRHPETGPDEQFTRGGLRIYLYSEANVDALRKLYPPGQKRPSSKKNQSEQEER